MIAAGHGVSIFAEEGVAANTANVVFLAIRDEPEAIPFSAVWSQSNRDSVLVTVDSIYSLHPRKSVCTPL